MDSFSMSQYHPYHIFYIRMSHRVPYYALPQRTSWLYITPSPELVHVLFSAAAPNVWNSLPSTLRHATTLGQFNKLLKKTHLYRNT